MKMKYDSPGNCVNGQAALQQDGYHRSKQKFDDRDNEVEIAFFDQSGGSVETNGGYHRRTFVMFFSLKSY
jgi:hypothetical protein